MHISETCEHYNSDEMQSFINNECQKPQKQWIYNIIEGRREQEAVLYRDPDARFLIVPSTSDSKRRPRGYIAIFMDTSLRSIRDLSKDHVPLLLEVCSAGARVLPKEFSHTSFHYHPSVYQLHIHFKQHKDIEVNNPRIYPVCFVVLCLCFNADFFRNCTLRFKAHEESPLLQTVQHLKKAGNKTGNSYAERAATSSAAVPCVSTRA